MDETSQLTIPDFQGKHNSDLNVSISRLQKYRSALDLSTVCIIPNNGLIASRVAENWLGQITQMNQKYMRLMMIGMEKYDAYNAAIEQVLANPSLSKFKYILTMEEDVLAPPMGLVTLFEDIEKYDVAGGLAWTKGAEGHPMIYGSPLQIPQSFVPVAPLTDTVQECLGLGTGFTLYKIDIFKDKRVPKPWFSSKTIHQPADLQSNIPDLIFFENIHRLGYKVACDTRVKIGSYDVLTDLVW